MNKRILKINIVNGYIGFTSECEENVSMASDDFELFLKDLNEYLRKLKNQGSIQTRQNCYFMFDEEEQEILNDLSEE